ncbi:sirohydrochlorin chelatase [Streptomyces sp. JJ38]|uniref:sirohydrochlorin chelatase n=1 Tax=Streptomyces sp. JJ38 TaxID=2738128 RepID=UPI001C579B2F|nr:sirohydrochlorin chelatase [Streptomyces sp. JJ38]MBW1597588.1 sirohydrochlorin chelatase [Streptomyces sp. JJ38]
MTTAPALLALSPGIRDEAGAEAVRSFVRALGDGGTGAPVALGFTGHAVPSPEEAVSELAARGVRRLVTVPLTTDADGTHAAGGLPQGPSRAVAAQPGLEVVTGRPLGAHPLVLDALERRVDEALGERTRTPADRATTTVLLVGRGSGRAEDNAEVHRVARLLWEGRGFAGVETAFVSVAAPDVASGLERCRALGARRIVVLPWSLFPDELTRRMALQAEGWSGVYPETDVRVADVVGGAPEVAELVWQRYREALACQARTGCDCCAHATVSSPVGEEG